MYGGDLVGKLLNNRYEIIEKIGTGGMATVYKARCHVLNRYVAIKVLREELKSDEGIVKKFHIESQAAASLSHHNIVSIHDVGEEDGNSYIVMEYVDGTTLKEYIKQKGKLDWKEAFGFAMSICSALDHAHKKHIIHRDIKPHNILMTRDKTLKVTDFGIARAVSSDTMVAGAGALGSVHYNSPEQARGGYTDERSDIYSTGIVLYEMIAGRVPFDGDNPVMIALQHLENAPQDIREIIPDIPDEAADAVMKAIQKEQHMRYQSAEEMKNALGKVLDMYKPAYAATAEPNNISGGGSNMNSNTGNKKKTKKPKTEQEKKEDRLAVIFAVITVAIIFLIGGGTYLFMRGGSREVITPDLLDMTLEEAQKAVEGTAFTIDEEYTTEESDEIEEGHIITQDPGANQSVKKKNTVIKLTISSGSGENQIEMQSVTGMEYDAAAKLLKEQGLKVEKQTESSDSVSEGNVIRQTPTSGSKLNSGDTVVLYVSSGSDTRIAVPNLSGNTQAKAETALKSSGFQLGNVTSESSSLPKGTVIDQKPSAGVKASKGSFVNIVLSSGPAEEEPTKTEEPKATQTPESKATQNPTAAPIAKTKVLTVTFPDWVSDTVNVKVVANGTEIYNKEHSKSEGGARVTVKGTKDAEVEIYIDGKLTDKKTITFD